MTKKARYDQLWMRVAETLSTMSHCVRKQVGCVILKDGKILSNGWNGTPEGEDNCCECEHTGETLSSVIHAEDNALRKLKNISEAEGSSVYITLKPCFQCSIKLARAKVKEVFYLTEYSDGTGTQFLMDCGIPVTKITTRISS